MVFCSKDTACSKNGKVKKGYREIVCKNGSTKYMTENAVKKPVTNPGSKKKAPLKSKAVQPAKAKAKPKPKPKDVEIIKTQIDEPIEPVNTIEQIEPIGLQTL